MWRISPKVRLWICLAFLAGLVLIASRALAVPSSASVLSSHSRSSEGSFQESRAVVRAYFDSQSMVDALAAWLEPWEVRAELGYLVVEATHSQIERMQEAGFRVEVDPVGTESYRQSAAGWAARAPGYTCYRTVQETLDAAALLEGRYPGLVTWTDIGDSWDKVSTGGQAGTDLGVLVLSNRSRPGPKPALLIVASIHAREMTTSELALRFAEYLLESYETDPDVSWLLDEQEIHLLFYANPDGRKYAEQGAWWRKNTNQNYCTVQPDLRGADLNRNFSFQWGCCQGSSIEPCDETYRGANAASEPEIQAVQNYLRAVFPVRREPDLTSPAPVDTSGIFIDLHSYGRLVLWPWGFTRDGPPNGPALQTLGSKLAYLNGYWPEQSSELYITDGDSTGFAYGELGLAAYAFELGTGFFESCELFESQVLPENLNALLYAAKVARAPYLLPAGPDATNPNLVPASVIAGQPVTMTATLSGMRHSIPGPSLNMASAVYTVDIPPWRAAETSDVVPMAPADGAYDSAEEQVKSVIDTTLLSPGRHMLYVYGQDAAGNWGPVSAAFLYVHIPVSTVQLHAPQPSIRLQASQPVTFTASIDPPFASQPLLGTLDFGDGTPLVQTNLQSTDAAFTHTFTASGAFTVTLSVQNAAMPEPVSDQVEILVEPVYTNYLPWLVASRPVLTLFSTGNFK